MAGFLNILLNVMNNRQREQEFAANQPYRDAQMKQLNLQNTATEQNLNDISTIRQAGQTASLASADPNAGPMGSMRKAVELGRPEYAANYAQVIDLNDKLDEMAARNKTWGGSEQYHSIKSQLDTASQTGKMLNELHKSGGMGMIRQVLSQNPELQKIVGDPEKLIFNEEGVMHPALHAQTKEPIPNWFYMVDQDGKTKMVEVKPNQEDLIDKRFENQLKLTTMMQDRQDQRQARQLAAVASRASEKAASKAGKTGSTNGKPLPVAALRLQKEELDAIGTASGINADLAGVEKQLASGKIKLGPVENVKSKGLNLAGLSTESSRNFATFQSTLEKLRNDSLRLNKGVQTEGDAQRAWNEIMNNVNDKKLVQQRLKEVQRINQRAVDLRRNNIDVIRANYGAAPLNTEKFENVPGAIGGGVKGNEVKKLDATTAQKFLRQAGGNKDKAREMARKAGFSF